MKTFNFNGTTVRMSAYNQGTVYNVWGDRLNHYKYIVTVKTDSQKTSFTFHDSHKNWRDNVNELDDEGLKNALYCFLSDASCYDACKDFHDFCTEFGYSSIEDYGKAKRAFDGCKRHSEAANRLFADFYTILDELNN